MRKKFPSQKTKKCRNNEARSNSSKNKRIYKQKSWVIKKSTILFFCQKKNKEENKCKRKTKASLFFPFSKIKEKKK